MTQLEMFPFLAISLYLRLYCFREKYNDYANFKDYSSNFWLLLKSLSF